MSADAKRMADILLEPLGVEINPRFYRGIISERSDNKRCELNAST